MGDLIMGNCLQEQSEIEFRLMAMKTSQLNLLLKNKEALQCLMGDIFNSYAFTAMSHQVDGEDEEDNDSSRLTKSELNHILNDTNFKHSIRSKINVYIYNSGKANKEFTIQEFYHI